MQNKGRYTGDFRWCWNSDFSHSNLMCRMSTDINVFLQFSAIAGEGGEAGPSLAHVKQLEQQNERLKMGLLTFRNLNTQDKQAITTLTKEVSLVPFTY